MGFVRGSASNNNTHQPHDHSKQNEYYKNGCEADTANETCLSPIRHDVSSYTQAQDTE